MNVLAAPAASPDLAAASAGPSSANSPSESGLSSKEFGTAMRAAVATLNADPAKPHAAGATDAGGEHDVSDEHAVPDTALPADGPLLPQLAGPVVAGQAGSDGQENLIDPHAADHPATLAATVAVDHGGPVGTPPGAIAPAVIDSGEQTAVVAAASTVAVPAASVATPATLGTTVAAATSAAVTQGSVTPVPAPTTAPGAPPTAELKAAFTSVSPVPVANDTAATVPHALPRADLEARLSRAQSATVVTPPTSGPAPQRHAAGVAVITPPAVVSADATTVAEPISTTLDPVPPAAAPSPQTSSAPALISPAVGQTPTPVVPPAVVVSPAPPAPATLSSQLAGPLFTLTTATPGEHTMTVKVAPEHLGPITVRAHITSDGVRVVELFAPTDAGRDALRAIMPDLRRDLAGSGMTAGLNLSAEQQPMDRDGSSQRDGGSGERPVATVPRPVEAIEPPARRGWSQSTIDVMA